VETVNLVMCGKDCVYQKDGYCMLEEDLKVSGDMVDGCCYFRGKDEKEATAEWGQWLRNLFNCEI